MLGNRKMYMLNSNMDISVTEFRARCLSLIRQMENGGAPVDIKRRGKVVARLAPPPSVGAGSAKPWEVLRGSGRLLAEPEDSVLAQGAFEASR